MGQVAQNIRWTTIITFQMVLIWIFVCVLFGNMVVTMSILPLCYRLLSPIVKLWLSAIDQVIDWSKQIYGHICRERWVALQSWFNLLQWKIEAANRKNRNVKNIIFNLNLPLGHSTFIGPHTNSRQSNNSICPTNNIENAQSITFI